MSNESFMSRWLRRKAAARLGKLVEPEPLTPPAPASTPSTPANPPIAEVKPELPPVESLQGVLSDYRAFMQSEVDPDVRRAALKKLFSDAHFNRMDGLDVYIDDYSKPDPIPAAVLASLEQAKSLLFNEPEKESGESGETEATDGPAHSGIALAPDAAPHDSPQAHEPKESPPNTGTEPDIPTDIGPSVGVNDH